MPEHAVWCELAVAERQQRRRSTASVASNNLSHAFAHALDSLEELELDDRGFAHVLRGVRCTRQALVDGGFEDVLDARGVVAAHAFDEVVGGDEGAHGVADGRRVARFRDLEA